jgi:protein-disulfide isomerase
MIDRLMRNKLALAGAFLLCALLGAGIFAAIQVVIPGAGERGRTERLVRDYILAHPEVLLESVDRYNARERSKAESAQSAAAEKALATIGPRVSTPYAGAFAGNPDGDVTVVAFMDYACGYCRASLPAIDELLKKDPKVRIVYREIPVLGPESVTAARWALAAAEQGKFLAFHSALYAMDGPSDANIAAAAKLAKLDLPRAEAAIQSKSVEAELRSNAEFGKKLQMTGTPTWVVGDKYVLSGARDYAGLAEAVAAARKGK